VPVAGPRRAAPRAPVDCAPVFRRIDHIGVAVEEIDGSLALWRDHFQMEVTHREVVEQQGVEAVLLDLGENHVELLAPLGPETPVGRFLSKRGPGLHHVAYQVQDIESVLAALRGAGLKLIDEQPRKGIRDSRVAFLHPASSGGVLTEIVQPALVPASGKGH
jgi:methylmalonyl-CoA/ethylmalonyl-CoA epimerase